MAALPPYISFRAVGENSLSFIDPPDINPAGALTASTSILLLIHGYNNTIDGASSSYGGWRGIQQGLGGLGSLHVVHVFWPGSNWESFAVYMQAIFKAREAAKRLARELRAAAARLGLLRVRIVTHSLGSRLTVHLIEELQSNPDPRVQLEAFVLMAAAVPTRLLAPGTDVRKALDRGSMPFRSYYSEADTVLRRAFRLGESLAGQGFFPVALGAAEWRGTSAIATPRLTQERNTDGKHGDYWWGEQDPQRRERAIRVGTSVRGFLGIGAPARSTPVREQLARATEGARDVQGRVPARRAA